MLPQMVMTNPANTAAFCNARRRTSHRAAEYTVPATPTARTVTGLADPAHEDADQEEERGGASEDAHVSPVADPVPSLADRGDAAR
jgi:hypothetical protein